MIEQRKKDHVQICVHEEVAYSQKPSFDQYELKHCALPECSLDEVNLKSSFLGKTFFAPFMISSMTGGYANGGHINKQLARIAQHFDIPMGLGSQRVMVENPETQSSFSVVREVAPSIFIASNIGGVQLAIWERQNLLEKHLNTIVESVRANALIVHLNPLQELMQVEGDRDFRGVLNAIQKTVHLLRGLPVIVKETGAGITDSVAEKLLNSGIHAIDVAGASGTSWAKVELKRNKTTQDEDLVGTHSIFSNWGISTLECLQMVSPLKTNKSFELIASGGVYTAIDMLKSFALGADMVAFATPLIKKLVNEGENESTEYLQQIFNELRIGLCLCGVKSPNQMSPDHLLKRA